MVFGPAHHPSMLHSESNANEISSLRRPQLAPKRKSASSNNKHFVTCLVSAYSISARLFSSPLRTTFLYRLKDAGFVGSLSDGIHSFHCFMFRPCVFHPSILRSPKSQGQKCSPHDWLTNDIGNFFEVLSSLFSIHDHNFGDPAYDSYSPNKV